MKRALILATFLTCLALIYLCCFRSPQKSRSGKEGAPARTEAAASPQARDSATQSEEQKQPSVRPAIMANLETASNTSVAAVESRERFLMSLYETPIDFYGRIVDEKSNGIPAVRVRFMVSDKPPEGNTVYERLSDDGGFVSLTGIRGASIAVTPTKEGYYPLESGSIGFKYAPGLREAGVALPTADAPAVMVLKRKGLPETLVHSARRAFLVSKDGTPLDVNLAAPDMPPCSLRVEVWTPDNPRDAAGRYDWRCRLSVPSGGILERVGRFSFDAPLEGYQDFFDFAVSADAPNWRSSLQKEFFMRFNDQRFARVSFNLSTKGSHSATVESFLNPSPRSRNLEYDPAKAIEIQRIAGPLR